MVLYQRVCHATESEQHAVANVVVRQAWHCDFSKGCRDWGSISILKSWRYGAVSWKVRGTFKGAEPQVASVLNV